MVDHAAMNGTSLVMALRLDLVEMENLPKNLKVWPVGIGGKDPRIHASKELGDKIITLQLGRMQAILNWSVFLYLLLLGLIVQALPYK